MKLILNYKQLNNKIMNLLESSFSINDTIEFVPMYKQAQDLGIAQEKMYGTIVAIRFTKAKVFYDILDDYYGKIFSNVDSSNVYPIVRKKLFEEGDVDVYDDVENITTKDDSCLGEVLEKIENTKNFLHEHYWENSEFMKTEKDAEIFIGAIENPPKPNGKLMQAVSKHKNNNDDIKESH